MTKTFDELDDQVQKLEENFNLHQHTMLDARVKKLEVLLEGSVRGEGWIDRIEQQLIAVAERYATKPPEIELSTLTKRIHDVALELGAKIDTVAKDTVFAKRLEAFFGPLMRSLEGRPPPLDGNEFATKQYIDKHLEVLARTLRAEMEPAVSFVKATLKLLEGVRGWEGRGLSEAFAWLWSTEQARYEAAEAAKSRPSRLHALAYALTGRNGSR